MKRTTLASAFVALALCATRARADEYAPHPPPADRNSPAPDLRYDYQAPQHYPTFWWALAQLVPSPEIVWGNTKHIGPNGEVDEQTRSAFGLRWQVTPALWSWGVHRKQPRWRFFVVDPLARHSGSIELATHFEYVGGHVDRLLSRPTLRAYLPLAQRGEYLSFSMGTSIYAYDGLRVAYEAGIYTFAGVVGVQFTYAPSHAPMQAIATLRLKYF